MLVDKLSEIDDLISLEEDSTTRGVLLGVRDDVLRRFYSNDILAYDVSREKDSYELRARRVVDRFGSFRKRCGIDLDEQFDRETTDFILSMNNVGVVCNSPMDFRTKEWLESVGNVKLLGAFSGGALGLVLGCAGIYCNQSVSIALATSVALAGIVYGVLVGAKYEYSPFFEEQFLSGAKETDIFVRNNKVRLSTEEFVKYART